MSHIHNHRKVIIFNFRGGRPLFSEIYKKFFIKFEEPLYVKNLKMEILVQIANETNFQDILNEMEEYVNDVNSTWIFFPLSLARSYLGHEEKNSMS